ncbi:MAG: helix-turn-helix domain-containing protein [Deltaproteobacteria bacterium]|nr:helix-turn-helix domain-containing protein [Deltaproteobacteria bacterium]
MPKRCVECRSRELVAAEVEERLEVAGKTFTATIPTTKCAKCGATYLSHDAVGVLELGAAGELARHGEVSAEAFSFMRRALGVRAVELAELLDVTPETVSRWEHGRQPIDRGAAALLSSMVLDRLEGQTTTLDRLKTLLKPEPLPKLVRLVPRLA